MANYDKTISVNDPDNMITTINDPKLKKFIEKHGSIKLYRDNYYDDDIIIDLNENNFKPSKTQEILWAAGNSFFGDNSTIRLFITLQEIGNQVWVEGDQAAVEQEFNDHKCWEKFDFIKSKIRFSIWWVGSFEDMAQNSSKSFQLVCQFKLSQNEIQDIMQGVFPNLKYLIIQDKLVISSVDLANYYKSKNNLQNI